MHPVFIIMMLFAADIKYNSINMTIVFLSRRFYPYIGGVERHVLELSKILIKKGHKVVIITESLNNIFEKDTTNPQEVINNLEIIRINAGDNNWYKKFRIWNELLKHMDLFKNADIIHCHDVFFWYLPFRFIFPFKKVYITFHGYETKYPPETKAILVRKISEILSLGNICIGDYIKKWYYTQPNYVSYGGVEKINDQTSKIKDAGKKLKIVLIGRLDNDIGIKTYLKSLEMLKKGKIKFEFQTFGEGTMVKTVKRYGEVNNFTKDINSVIESADIVFASSYLIMLQALAAKKIVIGVYENNLKDDYLRMSPFKEYVYICKDSKEISDVIKSIAKDPWKSNAMLDNGYKWAREQTWEKVTDIYLKLWKI